MPRHDAGRTRSAGAGPARTGECASGSPRTHLGVGFVRMCSHLRRSRVLRAEATSTLVAPGENSGNQGERERRRRQQGGGFPGVLLALQVRIPGVPAPRPASGGWDLLGLAHWGLGLTQKSPFPVQTPRSGLWQHLGLGMLC